MSIKKLSGFKWHPHKVVVLLFFSHIISFHLLISLLMHSSVSYTHTCLICVPRTAQLLMINITFLFLISKWRNFLIILFCVSFKLTEWGFATSFTFRRHATATTNPWVVQCTVCSVLKLDTFTLVIITFEWLGRFWKTKFSMKADYITKVSHYLLLQNTKPVSSQT